MSISEMHWEFDFRYNKLNSNDKKQLTPMEKDALLNDATLRIVEYIYKGVKEKAINQQLDFNQFSMDSLSSIMVSESAPLQVVRQPSVDLTSLQNKYLHFVRAAVNTDCGSFNLRIVQSDDLNMLLKDQYGGPSSKWRRALGVFIGDKLNIYLPDNVSASSVQIDYLKYPAVLYYGSYSLPSFTYSGYDSVSRVTTGVGYQIGDAPVSSDLPEHLHTVIVDMAVEQVSKRLYDANQAQFMQDNISSIL